MSAPLDTKRKLAGRAMLADDSVGTLVHAVLASLLEGLKPLTVGRAEYVTDLHLPANLAATYRQSLRQRVTSAVMRYEMNFRRPDWRLIGTEINAGDVRLDLLFMSGEGKIYVDEIKTGTSVESQLHTIRRQAEGQVAEGIVMFGKRFAGVRVVLLGPSRSLWFGAIAGDHE